MSEYGLVVSFPDQSESFVHGFEMGVLWQQLKGTEKEIETTLHTANRETVQRMAIAAGWSVEYEPSTVEGWDNVKLTLNNSQPNKPNPHGLRVVQ